VTLLILNDRQRRLQSDMNLEISEDSGQREAVKVFFQEVIQAVDSDAEFFINGVGHGRVEAHVNPGFEQTNA
jgi:hypothetical protein